MTQWHKTYTNFFGGEVSPRYNAVDVPANQSALSEAVNAVVLMQGAITKRTGTSLFRRLQAGEDSNVRITSFYDQSNRQTLALFTPTKVSVIPYTFELYTDTPERHALQGYTQHVVNPRFTGNFSGYTRLGQVSQTVTDRSYPSHMQYYQGPVYAKGVANTGTNTVTTYMTTQGWPETVRRNYLRQSFSVSDARFFVIDASAWYYRRGPNAGAVLEVRLGASEGGTQFGRFIKPLTTSNQTYTIAENIALPDPITGTLFVEISLAFYGTPNKQSSWEDHTLRMNRLFVYSRNDVPVQEETLDTPYSSADIENLHFIQSPFDDQELLCLTPGHPIYALYFSIQLGEYVFEEWDIADPEPALWGAGYPTIAAAFQSRLVLTGAAARPETVWASKPELWNDFDFSGQIDPSDGIAFTPTERGQMTWLHAYKQLLMGSVEGEYAVASQSGILQASDVGVYRQSYYGALRNPQKIAIGGAVALPTAGNTALRLLSASNEAQGFIGPDLLAKAEHLGKRIIRRYFLLREPHNMLWCIMADGTICVMSYDDQFNISAWTQFVTDGRFIDGHSFVGENGRTAVVLIVERVINGQTSKFVETITNLRSVDDWSYLDCAKRVVVGSDDLIIGGFEHLANKTCHMYTDFEYQGTVDVDENGLVEIPRPAKVVEVGIGYEFRVTTLPENTTDPSLSLAGIKRFSSAGIRGVYSRPPIIQDQRPPERSANTAMDIPQPEEAELTVSVTGMRHDSDGRITVREPLPIRTTITAIFGKIESNKL